jgi:hypothetical protein
LRRKVLDLVEAGRPVADVARARPGEKAEPTTAKRRITALATERAIDRRACELLGKVVPPKRRLEATAVMTGERLPMQLATQRLSNLLGPSPAGAVERGIITA